MVWYFPIAALFFALMGLRSLGEYRRWRRARLSYEAAERRYQEIVATYEGCCATLQQAEIRQNEAAEQYRLLAQRALETVRQAEGVVAFYRSCEGSIERSH